MTLKKILPFLLFIILGVYILFQRQAKEKQAYQEARIEYYYRKDSLKMVAEKARLKEEDALYHPKNMRFVGYDFSFSINKIHHCLINSITKNATNNIDTLTPHELTDERVNLCKNINFSANQHTFTYSTCVKEGPFWSKISLDENKITTSEVEVLKNSQYIFNDENFRADLSDIKLLRIGNKKYWEIRGGMKGCQGQDCLWTIFLLYDLQRNQFYGFKGFRIDQHPNFMDLDQDGRIDYLEAIYSDEYNSSKDLTKAKFLTLSAYTQNDEGRFVIKRDSTLKAYQIKAKFEKPLENWFNDDKLTEVEKHWMNPVEFPKIKIEDKD